MSKRRLFDTPAKRVHQARQKTAMQERDHSGNPTLNPRAEDQSLEHLQEAVQVQLVKKMGMPIPRISRKLAKTKVQARPSSAERLCEQSLQIGSLRRHRRDRRQIPNFGNTSNLVNELLFFGYTFSIVPYQAIGGFPPRLDRTFCEVIHYTPELNQLVRVLVRFPRGTTTGAQFDQSRPR